MLSLYYRIKLALFCMYDRRVYDLLHVITVDLTNHFKEKKILTKKKFHEYCLKNGLVALWD